MKDESRSFDGRARQGRDRSEEGEEPGEADGKSVMQLIILAALPGTEMRIEADGDDAQAAVDKLVELIESKFGEGE